jgi:drug/metabolite transporter (DMT)-like permease
LLGGALLLSAAVIWGFAFVPQKLTVTGLLPLQATALRFALAAPLALAVALSLPSGGRPRSRLRAPGVPTRYVLILGIILFAAYATQTAGLAYAPVARVSLITGLYAVFVPLFAPLLGHRPPTMGHWAGVALAFVGLLGLTGVVSGDDAMTTPLNIGDIFVLLHAAIGAFQVLLIGKLARAADPFALNGLQLVVVMALAIPAALFVEGMPDLSSIDARTWMSFGYLAAFSTVVAFTCQIFGQRHTSPPTAAVIMLLETPIGVLAALVLVHETMAPWQWAGAAVLLGGVAVSLRAELRAASTP